MLLNLLLIAFLGFTAYWWGSQGLFSALLHLVVTIVAGALALCLWEPIASRMLGSAIAPMAWSIGLVLPFAVLLVALRLTADRLIRGNVQHQPILSWLFGGAFGLLSGILTAGLTLIGLGFMPFGAGMAGVQPYAVSSTNQVVQGPSSLWVPVDDWTEGFYDYLSKGAFGTATPLARYQPELALQAHLSRLTLDVNASRTAHPDTVEVADLLARPVPILGLDDRLTDTLGPDYDRANHKLLLLETVWQNSPDVPTTYDSDTTARVFWNQVRLVTDADAPGAAPHVHGPIGVTQEDVATGNRLFRPLDDTNTYAFATRTEPLVFAFLLPESQTPSYVLIRNTRFDLTDLADATPDEPELLVDAIGTLDAAVAAESQDTAGDDEAPAGDRVQLTNALPRSFSPNYAQGIDSNNNAVENGSDGTATPGGRLSAKLAVREMYAPSHQRMVRITVPRRQAHNVFGNALASAQKQSRIWLSDTAGNEWPPIGFVIDHGRNGDLRVFYNPMENALKIPTQDMSGDDTLYLYFLVAKGVTLDAYHFGDFSQDLNLDIPR
jgi:hypothetical protein